MVKIIARITYEESVKSQCQYIVFITKEEFLGVYTVHLEFIFHI